MPGALLAFLLLPATIVPLILQPDFGQTMLVTIVWCGLFFVAGLHWFWVIGLGGAGLVGIVAAYEFLPARARPHRAVHGQVFRRHASRSILRWNRSPAAAGSAAVPGRAR